jgi:hypothetical protein
LERGGDIREVVTGEGRGEQFVLGGAGGDGLCGDRG